MTTKSMRYALGFAAVILGSTASAQGNYALGPVESTNSKVDVVVLGQRFAIDSSTICTLRGKSISKQGCSAALSRYAYVVVEGDELQINKAARITVLPFSYVPGASTVMVGARVTSVRPDLGVASLGALLVDNTALLAGGAVDLKVGSYVEVSGTQPGFGSSLLADGLRFSTDTITGTGRALQTQTITGTGRQSQTITGTGIQTITGTGIQTITGTGIQTITGTGIQTITGTGTQTITGTGTQTITGTGAQALTITGTGKATQTITGTGAQALTITGTGKATQTITGTGAQAQTITGTGKATQVITGTGAQVQTITGTGKQSADAVSTSTITGTGRLQTQTITGTGRQ
jgi:hypothetical protein